MPFNPWSPDNPAFPLYLLPICLSTPGRLIPFNPTHLLIQPICLYLLATCLASLLICHSSHSSSSSATLLFSWNWCLPACHLCPHANPAYSLYLLPIFSFTCAYLLKSNLLSIPATHLSAKCLSLSGLFAVATMFAWAKKPQNVEGLDTFNKRNNTWCVSNGKKWKKHPTTNAKYGDYSKIHRTKRILFLLC